MLGTHLNHSLRSVLEISGVCEVRLVKNNTVSAWVSSFPQKNVYRGVNGKQQLDVIRELVSNKIKI